MKLESIVQTQIPTEFPGNPSFWHKIEIVRTQLENIAQDPNYHESIKEFVVKPILWWQGFDL